MIFRKVVWGSTIAKDPPTVTYEEAMTDQGLFKWLSKVVSHRYILRRAVTLGLTLSVQDKFGFCFVSGVPATPEDTEKLSERIGFIRETKCK